MTNEIDRVRRHTTIDQLARIDRKTAENVRFYSAQSDDVIARWLDQLDREWSMERYLVTNASALALTGLLLGAPVNRK